MQGILGHWRPSPTIHWLLLGQGILQGQIHRFSEVRHHQRDLRYRTGPVAGFAQRMGSAQLHAHP